MRILGTAGTVNDPLPMHNGISGISGIPMDSPRIYSFWWGFLAAPPVLKVMEGQEVGQEGQSWNAHPKLPSASGAGKSATLQPQHRHQFPKKTQPRGIPASVRHQNHPGAAPKEPLRVFQLGKGWEGGRWSGFLGRSRFLGRNPRFGVGSCPLGFHGHGKKNSPLLPLVLEFLLRHPSDGRIRPEHAD